MIPEIGHFALWLAAAAALLQAVAPTVGLWRNDAGLQRLAVPAAVAQGLFTALAFAALTWAFVVSDFSVKLVAANSHSMKPDMYRFTGVWANHEGSLLLWVLVMALAGLAIAFTPATLGSRFRDRVLSVQGLVALGFFAFLLLASNPFERLSPAPTEGQGLNPLLQDPGLAFHPPLLYAGYVGLSVAFAFAVGGMLENRVGPAWARATRPWVLGAWALLTLGIALGSYWAYYELGWGGWWFWDPVENAALMPWLAATALLHSLVVVMKRDALRAWTLLLAVAAFSLSMMGTFIVRSGLLTSVHAFAVDPARGLFLVVLMALYIGGALTIYALAAGRVAEGRQFHLVSRESVLVANNLLISAILGVVFLGTLYPMALEAATGTQISVGPPYFNRTTLPLLLAMTALMAVGPFLGWKRSGTGHLAARLLPAGAAAAVFVLVAAWPFGVRGVGWLLGFGAAAWLGAASLSMLLRKGVTLAIAGMALAHLGVAISILGATASGALQREALVALRVGDAVELGPWRAELLDVRPVAGPNWTAIEAQLEVKREGHRGAVLKPQSRMFVAPAQETTESGRAGWRTGELYAVLGKPDGSGRWQVHLWVKPMVRLIWWGGLLMAFGGLLALGGKLRAFAPHKWRRQLARPAQGAA
ncbi:heme lyase CcmF/NrfE family subunit [Sandaracinobacter sp. RS1-74]|uniref:heme lyase CcmF/NrfE family subunit n=1 Tax=Sandaracinobacteroides sayramensis TaxID=2913411 RepID=UPI001ED9E51D|nr:heme lyase CcmF/NrfE family subunit [Sandaracinobacteroides sayramensis]MCG2841352.1 heme lyase CcmF/NrfE family subunit [Sandaracinobacteroides sayramensis]